MDVLVKVKELDNHAKVVICSSIAGMKFIVEEAKEKGGGMEDIMELRQVYEQLQGDYDSVLSRLLKEERITKHLLKFIDKNMDVAIHDALNAKDYETAFREAHSLKGVCANLNLDKLGSSVSVLTDALRSGEPEGDITALLENMQSDYDMTIRALNNLK